MKLDRMSRKQMLSMLRALNVSENGAVYSSDKISNSDHAAEIITEQIEDFEKENLIVLCLDETNTVIQKKIVSIGTVNTTIAHPREVFRAAIFCNASSIIIGHNHPSGNKMPSSEDTDLTRRIQEAGCILGISLTDSVIVTAQGDHFSFRGMNML